MTIIIKTRLSDAIYRSDGGGQVRVHYEWATGPRNLLTAIERLNKHSREMTTSYGNIGHNRSWIEIDGIEIPEYALSDFDRDTYAYEMTEYRSGNAYGKPKSLTERARQLIRNVTIID